MCFSLLFLQERELWGCPLQWHLHQFSCIWQRRGELGFLHLLCACIKQWNELNLFFYADRLGWISIRQCVTSVKDQLQSMFVSSDGSQGKCFKKSLCYFHLISHMLFQLFIKCFIISLPAKGSEYVVDSVYLSVCLISTLFLNRECLVDVKLKQFVFLGLCTNFNTECRKAHCSVWVWLVFLVSNIFRHQLNTGNPVLTITWGTVILLKKIKQQKNKQTEKVFKMCLKCYIFFKSNS